MEHTSDEAPPPVERGTTIGRYVVLGELGRGGMGTVWSAFDPDLDRKVALKLLPASSEHSAADLGREARILAKLAHPNVAAIYDVGRSEHGLYIAMELVDGGDLARWQQLRPRAVREILEVFLDAGRGLAAAHDKGLVHRDFKPTNVLIGSDQRVRVADFGLARLVADEASLSPGDSMRGLAASELTEVVGTPGFIAPEVLRGEPPDARSDQYSFCVSLVWCLTGSRPDELRDVDEALASSSLPRGARRAIVRGLSPRPDERFESMPALLQALAARPRSRARLALALGLGLAGGGALTWSVSRSSTPADRCAEGRAALESTWNEERAAGLRESLTHTAVAHAEQTSQRVLERLDAHAQQWSEAHASLCARAPGDPEVEGRLRCLDDRLIELDALGSALAEPDGASVDLASQAVAGLRSPRACTGDEWTPLPANLEPPPSIATQVDALRPRLELGSAYEVTGQFERALAVLAEVSREAESLGYAPMVAQAGYLRGLVLVEQGRYDEAKQALERAFMTAFGVADDATMVQSAALLASTMSSRHADLPRAELWNELARSAAERYGLDSEQGASYWQSSGILAFRRGEYDRSREALERALALYRAHLPADHPTIPAVLSLLAALEATERRYVEAEAKAREVLALRTALLGDRHPDLITDEVTLASALTPQGKPDEAIEHLERALALGMASLDPEHPRRLGVQNNLATALNRKGEHERARELYAEILRVRLRDLGREDPATALAHHNLASTLYHVGAREEALEHHREAVAIFEAVYGRDHERVALALNSQATTLEALGRCDEAEQTVARAWTIIGEAAADEAGERHPLAAFVADTRASIALCRGDEETALASARLAVEIAEATPGEPRATLPRFLVTLAQARLRAGETQEADDAARRAIDLLGPASPVSRVRAELVLAAVARARGDEAELRSHLERAKAHLPADGPRRESLARQIDELGAEGRDLEPR